MGLTLSHPFRNSLHFNPFFLALFPKETEDTTNIVEDLSINMKHGNGARNSLSGKIVLADTETQDVNGEEVQDGHVDQEKQN